ncbi:MAG: hypothetical protein NTY90_03755 [Candidatus Micrarchaeota archaeon]|nr:hypothetical protein [Candidatus Micrarchaeota archaeon]
MLSVVQLEEKFPTRRLLRALGKAFKTQFSFPTRVVHVSRAALSHARNQWDAEAVLDDVEKKVPGMSLGLFPHDMYVGVMNFVFGAAHLRGRAGVLSYYRLRPPPARKKSEEKAVDDLFMKRVEKEAVHEVGHVLGLHHCGNERCVMSFSPSLYWVDFKKTDFCPACAAKAKELVSERLREK